jgi:glycosyltransferase involved in cell wall biosynthesis
MLTGDLKWGALRTAEALVLPSHQENFGIAVAEALACGCPVLISRAVNTWREIEAAGAGWADDDTVGGCARLLERWLLAELPERRAMSTRARDCFRQNFDITQTAARLVDTIRPFLPAR